MKIEVLGTGYTTCNTAEAIVKDAVAKSGVEAQVIKVSNRMEIAKAAIVYILSICITPNEEWISVKFAN
jgi:hypothetical protein